MDKQNEVAAGVWDRSTVIDDVLRHVTYLCLERVNSTLTNNALYIEHTNCEKWFIYDLQVGKLPRVFKSLLDSIGTVLAS